MKLAKRMNRLGTETAFEVLAKAKILEAEGVDVIHLIQSKEDDKWDKVDNLLHVRPNILLRYFYSV